MSGLTEREIDALKKLPIHNSGHLHDIYIDIILELEIKGFVAKSLYTGTGGFNHYWWYIPTDTGKAILNLLGQSFRLKRRRPIDY